MLHGRTDILFLAENYAREGSLPVLSTSTYPISPNRQPGSAVAAAPGGGRGCDGGSRERSQSQIELIYASGGFPEWKMSVQPERNK